MRRFSCDLPVLLNPSFSSHLGGPAPTGDLFLPLRLLSLVGHPLLNCRLVVHSIWKLFTHSCRAKRQEFRLPGLYLFSWPHSHSPVLPLLLVTQLPIRVMKWQQLQFDWWVSGDFPELVSGEPKPHLNNAKINESFSPRTLCFLQGTRLSPPVLLL